MVVFSWIFRRNGGFFVDFSSIWWFFLGFVIEVIVFSMIFRRINGFFIDLLVEVVVFFLIFVNFPDIF